MSDGAPLLDPDGNYTAAEVSAWLRHPVTWFYRNRAKLERERAFPQPIPSMGHPRWKGIVLLEWAATHAARAEKRAEPKAPRRVAGNVLDLRTEAILLAARKAGGASSAA